MIHFFRHGQGGPRERYDRLSDAGRRQAWELGRYLASHGCRFDAVISGGLQRQLETARIAREAWEAAGRTWPEQVTDEAWNEFDIEGLFRELAPRLAAEDAEFRRQYEAVRREAADPGSDVHRRWLPCDSAVLQAWLEERYAAAVESWPEFQRRIAGAFQALTQAPGDGDLAVFTSATPIGLVMSRILGFPPLMALRLAGVSYNTSVTTVAVGPEGPALVTFNATPHLDGGGLRTLR